MTTQDRLTISRESKLDDAGYKWGFTTDVEMELAPKGVNPDIVRLISEKKGEPEWLFDWRMKAFDHWSKLQRDDAEPRWAKLRYPEIDYQDIYYYAAPKSWMTPQRAWTK